ncbi:hypothetical protein [Nonomuraea sp. NPDC023979]|uniref:hypothetical protein n=1 Tax=Nonomuraea sp. NPDC023979 TaxID=3154796 RepID=UPI0033E187BF
MTHCQDAADLAAQITGLGFAVDIGDEPTPGLCRLTITGSGSWTATVDVPLAGGRKVLTIHAADPEQAAEFAQVARFLGCESSHEGGT